jgi:hypothetical protein
VGIRAPLETVWEIVHERVEEAPCWAGYLRRAVPLSSGPPGPGSRFRYDLDLPGDPSLVLENESWDRPRSCTGRFVDGPVRGRWSYVYASRNGSTSLTYEMDYELTGMLRFAGGLLKSRYEEGIRDAMKSLKAFVEGRGSAC